MSILRQGRTMLIKATFTLVCRYFLFPNTFDMGGRTVVVLPGKWAYLVLPLICDRKEVTTHLLKHCFREIQCGSSASLIDSNGKKNWPVVYWGLWGSLQVIERNIPINECLMSSVGPPKILNKTKHFHESEYACKNYACDHFKEQSVHIGLRKWEITFISYDFWIHLYLCAIQPYSLWLSCIFFLSVYTAQSKSLPWSLR